MSRDKFSRVYLKDHPAPDLSIPGPGAYTGSYTQVEKNNGQFSLRPRTTFRSMFENPTKHVPGPGQYNGNKACENQNGYTTHSKFRSPGSVSFSQSGKRFDDSELKRSLEIPGPGLYQNSDKAKTSLSNYKQTGAPLFSKTQRKIVLENNPTRRSKPF